MNVPNEKSLSGLASPSNLAMAALVGFLFVGTATDWKMLHGRAPKSRLSAKSDLAGRNGSSAKYRSSQIPSNDSARGTSRPGQTSDVADRRSSLHDMQTNRRELE